MLVFRFILIANLAHTLKAESTFNLQTAALTIQRKLLLLLLKHNLTFVLPNEDELILNSYLTSKPATS
jgi:hypothetical protein